MLLSTATRNTLLKKFEEAKSSMLFKVIVCGTISAVLIGLITRKIWLRKKQERDEEKLKKSLDEERQKRRAKTRRTNDTLIDEQRCVVCVNNPKEVICLPCGHVCLCEDCSSKIGSYCPVCRTRIASRAAAFIA